mmetsp:Transcript_58138/g.66994  ORF Transcript_58138/g.66994 Transcript_58138/m.66994 type:complete len:1102 (-) Transcript_58138:178-3483(-)
MASIEHITQLIKAILSFDNQVRKEGEIALDHARDSNLDQYFTTFVQLLKSSDDQATRSFCAVFLRKQLSAFAADASKSYWPKISTETAKFIKKEIFTILKDESSGQVRNQICSLIGELYCTIVNTCNEEDGETEVSSEHTKWDRFLAYIMELWSSEKDVMRKATFDILKGAFDYSSESFLAYKSELSGFFQAGLKSENFDIKLSALEALCSLLSTIEPREVKAFENLVPDLIETTQILATEDEFKASAALESLLDLVEAEPKIIRKHFILLFKTMQNISSKNPDNAVKQTALQIVCSYLDRTPKIFQDNSQYLENLMQMIFNYMIENTEEATDTWMSPDEGFNYQNDEDEEATKFGMSLVDRMISALGETTMLPLLSQIVHHQMKGDNWKHSFNAIMIISQVGEHISNVEDLKPIIQLAIGSLDYENPKIRYAALHAIGQLAEDCAPEFQSRFPELIVPPLLEKLDDEVPRVQGHVLAALTNFFENSPKEITEKYLGTVIEAVCPHLQQGIMIVRENAITAIAALAEASNELFCPYFEKIFPLIHENLIKNNKPEHKNFQGTCIESITLMSTAIGRDNFKKYSGKVIELLINYQNYDDESSERPKNSANAYLFSGWQRIALLMEDDFVPYLEQIIPSLLKLAAKVLKTPSSVEKIKSLAIEELQAESELNHEDAKFCLDMFQIFISTFKNHFINYMEPTAELVIGGLDQIIEEVRTKAAACLPGLLNVIKESNHPEKEALLSRYGRSFIAGLKKGLETEFDANAIRSLVGALAQIIDASGKMFDETEISDFSNFLLKLLKESNQRCGENQSFKESEDVEEDEVDNLENDTQEEGELQIAIAEAFGKLFKTHKELATPIAKMLCTDILKEALQPAKGDMSHKFGLYLVDDIIEHGMLQNIPEEWPHFREALLMYATDENCAVRQAAVYGIGMLAITCKDFFMPVAEVFTEKLQKAIKMTGKGGNHRVIGFAKDNAVAALGKCIRYAGENLDLQKLIPVWIGSLPLSYDKTEGIKQHEILTEMILKPNAVGFFNLYKDQLAKVVNIFGTIASTKFSNSAIHQNMKDIVKALCTSNEMRTLLEQATVNLSPLQQQKIQDLISSR